MKLRVGDKVIVNSKRAEWNLNNIDCFFNPAGEPCKNFDDIMQISLSAALGEPMVGTVQGFGDTDEDHPTQNPYVLVEVIMKRWNDTTYYSEKELKKVK